MVPDGIHIEALADGFAGDLLAPVRDGNHAAEAVLHLSGLPFPYHGDRIANADAVNGFVPADHLQQQHDHLLRELFILIRSGDHQAVVPQRDADVAFLFDQGDVLVIESEERNVRVH